MKERSRGSALAAVLKGGRSSLTLDAVRKRQSRRFKDALTAVSGGITSSKEEALIAVLKVL